MTIKLQDVGSIADPEKRKAYMRMANKIGAAGALVKAELHDMGPVGDAFLASVFLAGMELAEESVMQELVAAAALAGRLDVAAHLQRFGMQWSAVFNQMNKGSAQELVEIADDIYVIARDLGLVISGADDENEEETED